MREVGILEAKTNLSALVEAVGRDGEEIIITKNGKPAARLSRPKPELLPRGPKLSGAELLERVRVARERIAQNSPQSLGETWEDIKDDGWR